MVAGTKNRVMSALRSAVVHLHELGIRHGNIGPAYVTLDSKSETVFNELNSSKPVEDKFCMGGTSRWAEYDTFFPLSATTLMPWQK